MYRSNGMKHALKLLKAQHNSSVAHEHVTQFDALIRFSPNPCSFAPCTLQTHPSIGITKKSMGIMNDFVIDMIDKLAAEAKHDLEISGKESTLREWHFNTATKLVLPGELKKHGISEGTKAIRNFKAYSKK